MRTRIAVGLVATFAAGMALVPMSAKAFCVQTIYADRVEVGQNLIELRGRTGSTEPTGPGSVVWVSHAPSDSVFASAIFSAVSQRNLIRVTAGTIPSVCPAAGPIRSMGDITDVQISPSP